MTIQNMTWDEFIETDMPLKGKPLDYLIDNGIDLVGVNWQTLYEAGIDLHNVSIVELIDADVRLDGMTWQSLGYVWHTYDLTFSELIGLPIDIRGLPWSLLMDREVDAGGVTLSDLVDAGIDISEVAIGDLLAAGVNLSATTWQDLHEAGVPIQDGVSWDEIRDAGIPGPVVPNIHQAVSRAVGDLGQYLDMDEWHSDCNTAHCRAGWVVALAGREGEALETITNTPTAAAIIYRASDPELINQPNWYATHKDALDAIRQCAALECRRGLV